MRHELKHQISPPEDLVLSGRLRRLFPHDPGLRPGALLTNARQAQAAAQARDCLTRAQLALQAGLSPDAVLTDVEDALQYLGQLTGRVVRDDITSQIFQRFCVGK